MAGNETVVGGGGGHFIRMPKLRRFLLLGKRSNLCQRHSPRTSFNSKTVWLPYQINLSPKSTVKFPIINQSNYQKSADTLN